jgi:TolA-binding protein
MTAPRRPLMPDETVERLVHLAQQAPGEHLTVQEWAGLHRLEHTLLQGARMNGARMNGARGRPAPIWLRRIAVAGVLGAVIAGFALRLREHTLTFEVTNATVSGDGYISAGGLDASVRFSDHSDFGAEPGTRLRVSHLDLHGARVMLEGGLLHARIRPQPGATWTLDAGPYVVHVTGTEFDLAWRVEEQTLDLRLIKGSVTVDGPLANGGLKMVAGQHLIANAMDGSLSIVNGFGAKPAGEAPLPATPPASVKTAVAPTVEQVPLTSPSRAPAATTSARTGEQAWAARVARGDFAAVIDDAERRGIERSLTEGSPVDLAALADAARYARRPDLARRALTAERARFPATVQARDAAFFLGGLTESQKDDGAALDWYEVYQRESPQGAYASQALGRKMMLLERTRDADGARRTAIEYLQRFAGGPYAPAARKLLPQQ